MNPECDLERARDVASESLFPGRGISLGVPRSAKERAIGFLLFRSHVLDTSVSEPMSVLNVDLPAYAQREPEVVDWRKYGISEPAEWFQVGERRHPRGEDLETWRNRLAQLREAIGVAAMAWWSGKVALRGVDADAVRFIRANFDDLSERGLGPYYRAMAPEWFAWIERVSLS